MKLHSIVYFCAISLGFILQTSGQSFLNLNFEQSRPFNTELSWLGFDTGWAKVPGWTAYNGWEYSNYLGAAYMPYNNETLDMPGVFLEGTNYFRPSLAGKFSIFLKGGDVVSIGNGTTSLGQTGQIPFGTQSLVYWGDYYNNLQISFNGQSLSFNAISNTANFTVYAADVSAYAGLTGELRFSAVWNSGGGFVDNIQFSTTAVPEPRSLMLFSVCILLFLGKR